MKVSARSCVAIFAVAMSDLAPSTIASAQQLNVICSVQAEWCSAVANEFQRETGIKVALTLKGSGESMAQLAAEKANPKLDVWFGGTGDPHLQAAEQDLTLSYKSPMLEQLQPWAKKQAEQSGYRTLAWATTPNCWRRKSSRSRRAGAISANRNTRATCRWPIPMLPAPRIRRSLRWCRFSARRRPSSC